MSTVYRAFDTVLERQVAIKLMHREIAGDSDQLERFRREARAVAQLNHPHIVGVIDAGEEGDPSPTPYIVFEYVEGETLKERIRRNSRLSIAESIAYAIEIARALGAAHERQIVHRDVKPQNVLIDEEGAAKVTDFGIARTLHQEGLTADGRVLGTTDYVSPEQALGHAVSGPVRPLLARHRALRDAHRRRPVQGREPDRGRDEARARGTARRAAAPSRGVRGAGRRGRPRDGQGPDRRYPDAQAMIADLEDVLAIETARTGQVTGEATTVLRSLPATTRRARAAARAQLAKVLLAAARARARRRAPCWLPRSAATERGTGSARTSRRRRRAWSPSARPARGDGLRSARRRRRAPERDERRSSTAIPRRRGRRSATTAAQLSKEGVGVVIDASPGVGGAASSQIRTPTPGFAAAICVADGRAAEAARRRAGRASARPPVDDRCRASRSTSTRPATASATTSSGSRSCRRRRSVEISEILLFR